MSHYHAVVRIDHQKGTVWQLAYARRHFAAIGRIFDPDAAPARRTV